MIAPIVKDPIVTKEDAEKFNNLFKEKVAKHLFIFCNYSPIIENLQGQSARYIPNILNLYIFAVDSCFFLRRLPNIVKDEEFNAIKGHANEIKKYVAQILKAKEQSERTHGRPPDAACHIKRRLRLEKKKANGKSPKGTKPKGKKNRATIKKV